MRVAAVQLNSTDDRAHNLARTERLVRDAAADGAELVALPEKWPLLGDAETLRAGAEPLDGPAVSSAREWARRHAIHLLAGSFAEQLPGEEKLANTSVLIGPDGEIKAAYRKIHMFDVDLGEVSYRESEAEQPGDEIVLGKAGAVPLGLTVCYDLRFPELFRILAVRGARVITVPSAFTVPTGRDHWEVLLRARAIENQVFIVAPNQVGKAPPRFESWGHSLILDPWGEILAQSPGGEGVIAADLDFEAQDEIRAELPSLANRQPGAYRWDDEREPSVSERTGVPG